ncbi:MAG: RNA polymerase sigma-54 factor, partial [Bradyrhizobium sp.]
DSDDVLSDDSIVERLRKADIVVARRTVAKYRDSLKIPSSVERRKLKLSPIGAQRSRGDSARVEA